jgi:hypothetical protein
MRRRVETSPIDSPCTSRAERSNAPGVDAALAVLGAPLGPLDASVSLDESEAVIAFITIFIHVFHGHTAP